MALTLEQARKLVVGPLRAALEMAGLSTVTDGAEANADVDRALAAAAVAVGVTIADPTAPTEEELASVPATRLREFIDQGVLDLLLTIRGNWVEVTYSLDGRSESFSEILAGLDRLIADRRTAVKVTTVTSQSAPVPGRILGGWRHRRS